NDGYLEPARELENLSILGDALVDRVVLEGGRAVGVELLHDGRRRAPRADQIVLCAGTIHSPGILMRSGIGPAPLLTELGIETVVNLPVGQGLQDHPMAIAALSLRPETAVKTPDDRFTNCCVRYTSNDRDRLAGDLMIISLNDFDYSGNGWPHRRMPEVQQHISAGAGLIGVWLNATCSRGVVRLRSR